MGSESCECDLSFLSVKWESSAQWTAHTQEGFNSIIVVIISPRKDYFPGNGDPENLKAQRFEEAKKTYPTLLDPSAQSC